MIEFLLVFIGVIATAFAGAVILWIKEEFS